MIHLDGQLETTDMTFAVVLCLNGFHPLMDRRGQTVYWTLNENEVPDDLEQFVSDYQRGNLLIEPRRFAREFAAMRKDVYRLLQIGDQPKGQRVARPVN